MSDYVRKKVIRYPFPHHVLLKCNTDRASDCGVYLKEKLGNLYSNVGGIKKFELEITDKAAYIDWVYYSSYGEESGDIGVVSLLTEKEISIIKPYFDKIGCYIDPKKLRKVDYCYYNCCECADYYNVDELSEEDLI